MTLRYEGVRFGDGSCAIRRVAADPCDRATLTFESMRELEEDVGSVDVVWLADRSSQPAKPLDPEAFRRTFGSAPHLPPPRHLRGGWQLHDLKTGQELRPSVVLDGAEDVAIVELQPGERPVPRSDNVDVARLGRECVKVEINDATKLPAIRVATIVGDPPRPAYVGDGHPEVRRARYEPTEEVEEP